MVKKELKLKGSMHGTKIIKSYDNPDIIHSKVDNHICLINDLKIKYLDNKKKFYIYHSYNGLDKDMNKNYTGRWYSGNYEYNIKDFSKTKKTFSITLKSIEWEDFTTGKSKIKNVKIKIQFTESGFDKLNKYFMNNL